MDGQKDNMDGGCRKEPAKKLSPAAIGDPVPPWVRQDTGSRPYAKMPPGLVRVTYRLTFARGLLATFPLSQHSRADVGENAGKTLEEYSELCARMKGIPHGEAVRKVLSWDKRVFVRNAAMELCLQAHQISGFLCESDKKLFPVSSGVLRDGVRNARITEAGGDIGRGIPIRRRNGGKMLSSDFTGIGGQRNPRLLWDAPREFAPAGCNVECAVIFMNAEGLRERIDRLLRHGSVEGIGGGRKSGMGIFTVEIVGHQG